MSNSTKNATIDPLAKVHPNATIGNGTTISAFSTIENDVTIGNNCTIATNVVIKNGTTIGNNNTICENAVIGGDPQDINFDTSTESGIAIGNNNTFREAVTIHRATVAKGNTFIGNNNFFMAQSHVGHDSEVHNHVIIANNTLLAGHVKVYSWAFVSGSCAVHQHARVGHFSMVSGLCGVSQDVPPGALVSGNKARFNSLNLVGMRRLGLSVACRKALRNFYLKFYELPFSEFNAYWNAELSKNNKNNIQETTIDDHHLLKNPQITYLNTPEGILNITYRFIKTSKRNLIPHASTPSHNNVN